MDWNEKDISMLASSYIDLHEILSNENGTFGNKTAALQ